MKPYLLFGGQAYYPDGGVCDFEGFFDTIEAARAGLHSGDEWGQIAVIRDDNLAVIEEYECDNSGKFEWRQTKGSHPKR